EFQHHATLALPTNEFQHHVTPLPNNEHRVTPTLPSEIAQRMVSMSPEEIAHHIAPMSQDEHPMAPTSPKRAGHVTNGEWTIAFEPPAANPRHFRYLLLKQSVVLETVHLTGRKTRGTVLVQPSFFEDKRVVFIRWTTDAWVTHVDSECQFVETGDDQ